jgi:hypothetical protein
MELAASYPGSFTGGPVRGVGVVPVGGRVLMVTDGGLAGQSGGVGGAGFRVPVSGVASRTRLRRRVRRLLIAGGPSRIGLGRQLVQQISEIQRFIHREVDHGACLTPVVLWCGTPRHGHHRHDRGATESPAQRRDWIE